MLGEFRAFIMRGNVVDLAVAVIMGVAFGAVVTALVEHLLMPLIAMIAGEPDFSGLQFTVNDAVFGYGAFINAVLNFLLVSIAVFFFIVKPVQRLSSMRQREEVAAEPPAPSEDVLLLREIRDLLQRQA
jgi:large conductance mechanosensitive channel